MPAILTTTHLQVVRNQQNVLSVDQFAIQEGELLAVIGPNGAGKSTLLMALSTLLPAAAGEIRFREEPINPANRLAYRRQIGMVLQDPLLLDTTVQENVATGLRFRGVRPAEIRKRVAYWLQQLAIAHLAGRKAHQISGGEAQRVSLARALALNPLLLFLDEPFSALDAPSRAQLITDFQRLQREKALTTLFVTHDQDEALLLADRVAVVMAGELRQMGTPHQVFAAPADDEVARFVGVETIIPGTALSGQEGLVSVAVNGYTLSVVGEAQTNQAVYVCLRPEDITLWLEPQQSISSARNRLEGKITSMLPQGALERIVIDCGFPIVALVTRTSAREMGLTVGKPVIASFKASNAHLVARA